MAVHVGVRGPGHLSRTFGWTPAALGSSLLGWWDAEDAATITQSGGLVSSWRDKVAGYDVAQATGASKPVYSATSFNSRPGLTFDGVDDELTYASAAAFPTGGSAGEIWVLWDQTVLTSDVSTRSIAGYGDASTTRRLITRALDSGVNRARADTGNGSVNVATLNTAVDFSGRHVVRAVVGASATRVDLDGSAGSDAAVTPATATSRTRIGANTSATAAGFGKGVASAFLITGALSDPQAAQLLTYLKARGGIV